MGEVTEEELESLQREFDWVLNTEVKSVIDQLRAAVQECASKFPIPVGIVNNERPPVMEKYTLTAPSSAPSDQLKVQICITGDSICQAEINMKLPRPHNKDAYHNTSIRDDSNWKLQQIQDAANHLHTAQEALETLDPDHQFESAAEVKHFLSLVMEALRHGRTALVCPKKKSLDELGVSKNVKSLNPPLPKEVCVSFYLQSWTLIFAVYHLITEKGISRFDRYQADCVVPWVNDAILLMTVALQTAQELQNKLAILSQYRQEININRKT